MRLVRRMLRWKDGAVARATLVSHSGGPCQLRYRDVNVALPTLAGQSYTLSGRLGAT